MGMENSRQVIPYTEGEEPNHAMVLRGRNKPGCTGSRIDEKKPGRDIPKINNTESICVGLRSSNDEPMRTESRTNSKNSSCVSP
jgi:hypothetical protein